MKNIRRLCAGLLVIIIVIITLCSCSNDRSEPTNAVSPAGNIFHELTLPAVTEGQVRSGCPRQPDPLCAGGEAALKGRRLRLLRDKTSRHLRCRCPEITCRLGTGDARQLLRRSPAGWRCCHSRPPAGLHKRLPRTVCGHVLRRFAAQPRRIHR